LCLNSNPIAKNPPDERLVYLALKNVFKGRDAHLRTAKKIRKLIQKHLDTRDEEVRVLVAEHNIDNFCNTGKTLLQNEIFASTLRAKIRFRRCSRCLPPKVQSAWLQKLKQQEVMQMPSETLLRGFKGRGLHRKLMSLS
jgi:hypothetical protein